MTRLVPIFLAVSMLAAGPGSAAGLPDTGQDICYDDTDEPDGVAASNAASVARDAGTHPRQDCRYGRDPATGANALPKTGAGAKGFDYTKIANNGTSLTAGGTLGTAPTDWACTRDNITGLTWEVKTATSTDLRYFGHVYSWYSSDGSTNGGYAGIPGAGSCTGGTGCDTEAFVADVNAATLCNHADWRMPTQRELLTLDYVGGYAGGSSLSIDPNYFPNTPALYFWSGTTAQNPSKAWVVKFSTGGSWVYGKTYDNSHYVRLVRGDRF